MMSPLERGKIIAERKAKLLQARDHVERAARLAGTTGREEIEFQLQMIIEKLNDEARSEQ